MVLTNNGAIQYQFESANLEANILYFLRQDEVNVVDLTQ